MATDNYAASVSSNNDTENPFWNFPSNEVLPKKDMKQDKNEDAPTMRVEMIESINDAETSPRQYRKGWRKPRGMPKRPMSSYNLFFQLERERLVNEEDDRVFTPEDIDRIAKIQKQKDLSCHKRKHRKSHGKISFSMLARVIADKWKALDSSAKAAFFERAALEKDEYKAAVEEWARANKCTPQSRDSSPTHPEFLAEAIESPPINSDQYTIQNQSTNTSPEIAFPSQMQNCRQGMWDTADRKAIMDQMMMSNQIGGGWTERGLLDRNLSMVYSDKYQSDKLNNIRNLPDMQSPTRPHLQPRFVPFSPDYAEQGRHFGMHNGLKPIFPSISDPYAKYSPSSVINNIYRRDVGVPPCGPYSFSPNQNVFAQTDNIGLRPNVKLMRSRSFPLEDRLFASNDTVQQQYMEYPLEERCQSHPSLHYPTEYGTMHELAGLPLDSLVQVSPGQYIDPSVYNVDLRKSNSFIQRRSTFSGGYNIEDKCQELQRMNPGWYSSASMINDSQRRQSLQYTKEADMTNSFPPMEIITVRRGQRGQESSSGEQRYVEDNQTYGNQVLPSPSSQYNQDIPLAPYTAKHPFPHDVNHAYVNEDAERAAIDLVSLSGMQRQRSMYAVKNMDETRSVVGHHPDQQHHSILIDDRDTSVSLAVGLPLNYHDEASFTGNHWEV